MVHTVGLQALLGGVWTDIPLMATAVTVTRGLDPYGTWPRPSSFRCEINNDLLAYDPSRPTSLLYGIAGRNTRVRIRPNGNIYLYAEASTWTPERTIDHRPGEKRGRSTTLLAAEGLLRRIGTWSDPIRSPMYRTISGRATSVGHWPLEDPQGVLALSNSLAGGMLGQITSGVTLGAAESAQGAASSAQIADGSRMAGRFAPASTTAGWQIAWSFRLTAIPATSTYVELIRWTTSNGYTWTVETNNNTYRFSVVDAAGTSLIAYGLIFGAGREPNRWITMRVKVSVSGGIVTVEPAWYAQGDTVEIGGSTTFAGTAGALDSWAQEGNTTTAGGWVSHVYGVTGTADSLVGATAQRVFNGYTGEAAVDRFRRLMTEQGLTRYINGTDTTMPMGPQRPGTLLDLLREIRDTDDCRIDDERFEVGLTLTPRRSLLNQTPALALTYPGDVYGYDKEIGDLNTHNRVTVKNTSGGEVTVSLESGPMSVQPPPAGVGLNPASVGVNLANERDLGDVAAWHLAKGTLESPLYRSVSVNLTANPTLATAATGVREGNLITITDREAVTTHGGVEVVADAFGRTVGAGGFGTADTGGAWTVEGTAAEYSVSSSRARMSLASVLVSRRAIVGPTLTNSDVVASVFAPLATGGDIQPMLGIRWTDNNTCYLGVVELRADHTVWAGLEKRVGGVQSSLGKVRTDLTHTAGVGVRWRVRAAGTTLRMRVWTHGTTEPAAWDLTVTDGSLTSGRSALRAILGGGNTNTLPVEVSWDDVAVQDATQMQPDVIPLLVVGINRTTRPGMDVITYACEPYEPYQAGVWNDPSFRYDSRTSTLGAGYSASATSMTVTHTKKGDGWSTTATPYEWLVGGERIKVTSMSAVTGSGPWTQTATVVRAVNGISKAQTAGTAVHLADAKRWGL